MTAVMLMSQVLTYVVQLLPAQPPIDIGRDEAQRRANEELSKGKYGSQPDWVNDLVKNVSDFFDQIFKLLDAQTQPGQGIGVGFPIAILIVLLVIALIIWKVGLPRWQRQKPGADADVGVDNTVLPQTYRERALAAAQSGDYSVAIVEQFRGLVRELEYQTVIEPRPARTAFEAVTVVSQLVPTAHQPMLEAAELFTQVMYGKHRATSQQWQRLLVVTQSVMTAVDQPVEVGQ